MHKSAEPVVNSQWLSGEQQEGMRVPCLNLLKEPEQSQRGYEDSDVSVGRLFAFAAGVVGLVVLGVLGSAAVFHFFVRHQPLGPPASPFEDVRDDATRAAPANHGAT